MKKKCLKNNVLFIAVLALCLQACTITRYRLRNDDKNVKHSIATAATPCAFNYSINVQYEPRLVHTESSFGSEAPQNIVGRYIGATNEAFKEKGCTAEQLSSSDQANFNIRVLISPLISALPQEWLTGLSLGLIPSWGTRYGEFVYTFENKKSSSSATRYVDRLSFNHLIVFPVFWISLLGPNDMDLYKKALLQFVETESSSN